MTTTITTSQQIPPSDWQWEFSSDVAGATFYVYLDEQLAVATSRPWFQATMDPGETVQFEVLDNAATAPQPAYPGRLTIPWYADASYPAAKYRLDEYVDSVWTAKQTINAVAGQTYYRIQTRYLEDETTHTMRIVPIAASGEEGTPLQFAVRMVRRPDPPSVSTSYSSATGLLTVAAS